MDIHSGLFVLIKTVLVYTVSSFVHVFIALVIIALINSFQSNYRQDSIVCFYTLMYFLFQDLAANPKFIVRGARRYDLDQGFIG